jgi:hypothetical protein
MFAHTDPSQAKGMEFLGAVQGAHGRPRGSYEPGTCGTPTTTRSSSAASPTTRRSSG